MKQCIVGKVPGAISGTFLLLLASFSFGQPFGPPPPPFTSAEGEELFSNRCAVCHLNPDPLTDTHTPSREAMQRFTPNSIYAALDSGQMQIQATGLTDEQKRLITATITGSQVTDVSLEISSGLCESNTPMGNASLSPLWNGWGPDNRNARFAENGGISASDLPNLKLKWAYGLPEESQARAQPIVVGGRVFVGNGAGALYSLDAESGCTYWSFQPRTGIRNAVSVAPIKMEDNSEGYAVFFVDIQANIYAVNAKTGEQIWVRQIEDHPAVRGTGSLTYHNGVLYVPMTGVSEESAASGPDYSCCTFRGSLSAVDAQTGEIIWRYFTVPEPQPRGVNANGVQQYGPAGVGIWSAPTIDDDRGLVYVATGNAYADPAPETSDAVVAVDIKTGEQVWVNQLLPGDAWIGGCQPGDGNENCPDEIGPDFDFSASPILTASQSGRELLVVPQKSGVAFAIDPNNKGELVWEYRAGEGSPVGGVWGMSAANGIGYVAVGGYFSPNSGGIHGVDLDTGARLWFSPPVPPEELFCEAGSPGCGPTQSAAVTTIPGAVFSGAQDGGMRAYDAQTGEVIWVFDANQNFETVNGVVANGGSFGGAGPVVAGGMLYMLSGNGGFVGKAGNVLLAFEIEE